MVRLSEIVAFDKGYSFLNCENTNPGSKNVIGGLPGYKIFKKLRFIDHYLTMPDGSIKLPDLTKIDLKWYDSAEELCVDFNIKDIT